MESTSEPPKDVTVAVKWQGKQFAVTLPSDADVGSLKRLIEAETNVLPARQKLLNVKVGPKMADDAALLSTVKLPKVVMMMGSTEASITSIIVAAEGAPEVLDDFDVGVDDPIDVKDRPENVEKLQRRIARYDVPPLNPPRDGKKLLVLDIDYTLFDHRSTAEHPHELMRPYLHEFLAQAYEHYDIAVWSATGMSWIELKMKELGVLSNPNYKIMQLVDSGAMISVSMEPYGMFKCKPLGWVWAKYEGRYGEKNTIMFDDLRRNFVMNPSCGLKIRPFRKAHLNRDDDDELVGLTKYLLAIKDVEDFTSLRHSRWEKYLENQENN
jgi:ubiquitin-like domain-containing CTD phosphatase 1